MNISFNDVKKIFLANTTTLDTTGEAFKYAAFVFQLKEANDCEELMQKSDEIMRNIYTHHFQIPDEYKGDFAISDNIKMNAIGVIGLIGKWALNDEL